jgi:hypothetical protein
MGNLIRASAFERAFMATPDIVPSGPITKAQANYQFVPRIDPTGMTRSYKRQYSGQQEDQTFLGECVGESGSSTMESIRNILPGPKKEFSDIFYYNIAKWLGNLRGQGDTGAAISDGLEGARLYGVPYLTDYPQIKTAEYYDVAPSAEVMALAAQHKLGRYERIEWNRDAVSPWREISGILNSAHAEGLRIIAGIFVPRWFFYINGPLETHVNQPGALGYGDPMLEIMGRHAILIEDFDNLIGAAGGGSQILFNSWGSSWGDNGRYACPNTMIGNLCFELWAVRSFDGVEVAPAPEVVLTPAQLATHRAGLQALGCGSVNAAGGWDWNADPTWQCQFATFEYLRRRNLSYSEMAQVVSATTATVQTWANDPQWAGRFAGWKNF